MHYRNLDLNLLVALNHMLALRSISRAAERMHMSQSAMSNALTRLRRYFDDELLVQVGRRMELTPRAEAMRDAVRDILARIETTISTELEFDAAASSREFSILLSDYTMTVLMPHVLALAHQGGATVGFRLLPQTEEACLSTSRCDVDLVVAPTASLSAGLPREKLFSDSYVVLAWRGGRFGEVAPSMADYAAARHVCLAAPSRRHPADGVPDTRHGAALQHDVSCCSLAAIPHLVIGADRLATVQRMLANCVLPGLPIVAHALPFSGPMVEESLQWHAHRSGDPGIRWLRGLFHRAAAQMVAAHSREAIPPPFREPERIQS